MDEPCVFCEVVAGRAPARIVWEDDATLALVDLRQAHPGHVLVLPRRHLSDVRELDQDLSGQLMWTVVRVTRAVGEVFANEGLSLWHSIGPAAFQEIPHLHVHIHPRKRDDGLLRVYPNAPVGADAALLDQVGTRLRRILSPT